jgi:hypothetical protein
MLIFALIRNCGISNRFNMPIHCSHGAHSCSSIVSTSEYGMSVVCRQVCGANFRNFFRYERPWYENHRLPIAPNMSPSILTSGGIISAMSSYFSSLGSLNSIVFGFPSDTYALESFPILDMMIMILEFLPI